VRQTNASPSRASRANDVRGRPSVSRGSAGRRRARGTTTRNERASRPSTSLAPDTANSNPATGGPSTVPSSCIPLRRALAATRSSSATTAGMHRPTAAVSGVPARASTKTTASSAPRGGNSSASRPASTAWTSQPALSRRAGGNRSAITPAQGAVRGGIACANNSNPTAVALPVVRCRCRIKAVVAIASPSGLMVWAASSPASPGERRTSPNPPIPLPWRKNRESAGSFRGPPFCVEVMVTAGGLGVRDGAGEVAMG
jgi:hypothetical protein